MAGVQATVSPLTASRRTRLYALAAACAALLAAVLIWADAPDEPRSAVVADPPAPVTSSAGPPVRDGWKTIEYQGVQVDIPAAWERLDMSDCEFRYEQWAPPKSQPCGFKGGVSFYRSATFDPFHGPGVWRTAPNWSGYVYAGEYAVYAGNADRDVVRGILDSARE